MAGKVHEARGTLMLMTPSLKQLRYFVEIVDAGNFSLAAERLFIAQSALSRQIRDMEATLQVELLVRKPRHVEPTAAGQAFYESARRILSDLAGAAVQARQVQRGGADAIRLLHSSSVVLTPQRCGWLHRWQSDHPAARFEVAQASSEQQSVDIEEGRADLGLARDPVLRRYPNIQIDPMAGERLVVAVCADHPMSRRESLTLSALREMPFVSLPHPERGGLSYRVAQLCQASGFYPTAAGAISRKLSQLSLVAAGFGVAVVPESMQWYGPDGVRFVPLSDAGAMTRVVLLSRRDAPEPVAALRTLALSTGAA
ncbi:LysR family transcriptional regulator [Cupriavidus metallidurans]|nr:LysR family transcriptional regulator [Cupriavidus metallidurans]